MGLMSAAPSNVVTTEEPNRREVSHKVTVLAWGSYRVTLARLYFGIFFFNFLMHPYKVGGLVAIHNISPINLNHEVVTYNR